jgi:Flp pilus assembly protein TadG
MFRSVINRFIGNENAAIGPLYAIGIGTFVVMSAIGFDYGRLMALDSELQNAADQAALAAATQLDGGDDAMIRARNSATNAFASTASTFTNETRFANDGQGRPITSLTFEFFDGYANDTPGDLLTDDADGAEARVVQVTVNARQVFYALTPLVGAINSGDVIGKAMAGLQSATCNVPPMMFCVPNDSAGNAITSFPTEADIGRGLNLHMNANAADPWAPGNFGFLDINYTYPNGTNPNHTLGFNEAFQGCTSDVIESETGVRDPQADALNSRFDMYNNSMNNNSCNSSNGNYCPAENVRRDWVNIQTRNNVDPTELAGLTCNSTPSNNWSLISNLPTTAGTDDLLVSPASQQLPRDNCLLSGSCGAVLGDGVWDGDAYMARHHPGVALSTAAPNGTRFEVYNWELEDKANRLGSPRKVGYYADRSPGAQVRYSVNLYCSFPQPVIGTGVAPSDTQKDRRLLTVAAVDCTGLNGSQPVRILRWVDLFLVQPAATTGSNKEFFTEIVGPAGQPNGDSGFQYFGRKKAVLIR